MEIRAIVLAAGLSSRMGSPKPLLPFGGRTVLQRVVDGLLAAGVDDVHVVLGHRAEEVAAVLWQLPVVLVENPRYTEGMFSSVLAGLSSLPASTRGALIALGDQPLISSTVAKAVVDAFRAGKAGLVVPTFGGRRGHPVAIDVERYGSEIQALQGDQGLKPVMRGHPEDTLELAFDDPEILEDIDTPEDYRRALAKWEKEEGGRDAR